MIGYPLNVLHYYLNTSVFYVQYGRVSRRHLLCVLQLAWHRVVSVPATPAVIICRPIMDGRP